MSYNDIQTAVKFVTFLPNFPGDSGQRSRRGQIQAVSTPVQVRRSFSQQISVFAAKKSGSEMRDDDRHARHFVGRKTASGQGL